MKAEALIQLNRGTEALPLIYQVRKRANALTATDLNPSATDKNGLTDFLLAERAREFAYEGKRWFDVIRNTKRNNFERMDILINMTARAVLGPRQQSAINKYKNPDALYLPIYYTELLSDPNLVQNPFYK